MNFELQRFAGANYPEVALSEDPINCTVGSTHEITITHRYCDMIDIMVDKAIATAEIKDFTNSADGTEKTCTLVVTGINEGTCTLNMNLGPAGYNVSVTVKAIPTADFYFLSAQDKERLDYLYNNAVVSYIADSSNISLMSSAGNIIAIIPVAASGGTVTKLDPQLTLSSDTVTIALGDNPSVTATRNGNGVISAVSANTNICTVEVDGTTIKLSGVGIAMYNEGTTTVTVYVAETDEYNAASKTITVTVNNTPVDADDPVVDPDVEPDPTLEP